MSNSFQISRLLQQLSRPPRRTSILPRDQSRSSYRAGSCWSLPSKQPRQALHSSSRRFYVAPKPTTSDRGPASQEDTQTDFGSMNVLSNTPVPTTSIDACLSDGFHLNNGLKISGGSGCLLVAGEAFSWRPWEAGTRGRPNVNEKLLNQKGQWDVEKAAWGVLDLMWPKPDLLILGLGPSTYPISPATRAHINSLGIRIEIGDTRNAASQFNLLATERGVGNVAAALLPIGRRERRP